eukprot:XP_001691242.1 predicted protein [Chlamydomonas reinhardtii]
MSHPWRTLLLPTVDVLSCANPPPRGRKNCLSCETCSSSPFTDKPLQRLVIRTAAYSAEFPNLPTPGRHIAAKQDFGIKFLPLPASVPQPPQLSSPLSGLPEERTAQR